MTMTSSVPKFDIKRSKQDGDCTISSVTALRSKRQIEKTGESIVVEGKQARIENVEICQNANNEIAPIQLGETISLIAKVDEDNLVQKRVQALTEEYVEFASNLVLSPLTGLGSFGVDFRKMQIPLESVSALGYLQSPVRIPTVVEKWSPYEIALFEAAIAHYGKEFHLIQRAIKTKSTKETVDFYYIWKKTSHYQKWKETYVPPHLDLPEAPTTNRKA